MVEIEKRAARAARSSTTLASSRQVVFTTRGTVPTKQFVARRGSIVGDPVATSVDAIEACTEVVQLAIQLPLRDAQDGSTLVSNAAVRRPPSAIRLATLFAAPAGYRWTLRCANNNSVLRATDVTAVSLSGSDDPLVATPLPLAKRKFAAQVGPTDARNVGA
jgi:hypothetical protein